jgi:hypothetical protein
MLRWFFDDRTVAVAAMLAALMLVAIWLVW